MTRQTLKRVAPLALFLALWLAWFGWYHLTTSTVLYEEHYPTGVLKIRGLVKRQPDASYKRHGLWREYEPDGRLRIERTYRDGFEIAATSSAPATRPAS